MTPAATPRRRKAWVDAHHFTRLIVVTSSYHMPRSLTELGRALPEVALVPYPVVPRTFRAERWWMHAGSDAAAVDRVSEVPAVGGTLWRRAAA